MNKWFEDDDALLDELRDAMRSVPPQSVRDAKAIYTWRTVDAELAALTYDSAQDLPGAVRADPADPAALRSLEFQVGEHGIALDINDDELHGQLLPAGPGHVEIEHQHGQRDHYEADEAGYLLVTPVPRGTIRLRCSVPDGPPITTEWIRLRS